MLNRPVVLLLGILPIVLSACDRPSATSSTPTTVSAKSDVVHYQVKGILRSINFADNSVTVEHEEVPDYMPAMTMPFDVKKMAEVQPLKAGDGMSFKLVVTDKTSWIEDIQKIDAAQVKVEPKRTAIAAAGEKVERLKEGDRVPDFTLIDQQGRTVTQSTFAGVPYFITFIFTRCPIPNFCPLMSQNFAEIQKAIADDSRSKNAKFLSISFDPEFDTPEVLSAYAQRYHADGETWRFATGSPEQVKLLTQAFAVYVQPEQGTITHGLATALVGADGKIQKIFRGNGWSSSEAVDALRKL